MSEKPALPTYLERLQSEVEKNKTPLAEALYLAACHGFHNPERFDPGRNDAQPGNYESLKEMWDLQCSQVADMCSWLGAEGPPDTWTLRDALIALGLKGKAAERRSLDAQPHGGAGGGDDDTPQCQVTSGLPCIFVAGPAHPDHHQDARGTKWSVDAPLPVESPFDSPWPFWGTCVDCPRDPKKGEPGRPRPWECVYRNRYDHRIPLNGPDTGARDLRPWEQIVAERRRPEAQEAKPYPVWRNKTDKSLLDQTPGELASGWEDADHLSWLCDEHKAHGVQEFGGAEADAVRRLLLEREALRNVAGAAAWLFERTEEVTAESARLGEALLALERCRAAATPVEAQPPRETCSCCQAIREVLTEAGIDASDTNIQPSVLVRRALAESRKAGWNAAIDEAAELFEDADWLDEPACPGESFPRCARMVRALRDPGRERAKR